MPRARKPPPEPEKPARRRRGDGSIQTLGDGTIRARLPKRIDPKRTAREFPPGHMADAIAWLDSYLQPRPASTAPAIPTLGDWSGTWWETYVDGIKPSTTARKYLYMLRKLDALDFDLIDQVRPSQLQAHVNICSDTLAPASLREIVGVWRRCFEAAVDDGLIARNPARRLVLPSVPKRLPARHVTAEEVAALWPAIHGHRFEAAYALMLGCGLRIGEILGLHWSNVDFTRHRLWVQDQFTDGVWRDTPKGRNPHWVALRPEVVAALNRHRASQPEGMTLVMQSPYRGSVSKRTKRPHPWSTHVIQTDLQAIVDRLGLDRWTPHAGRHGLASMLLAGGVDPAVIAERLGNSPAVVLATYSHPTSEGRERADDLLDVYLSDVPKSENRATNRATEDAS